MSATIKKLPVNSQVYNEIQEYKIANNGTRPSDFNFLSSVPEGLKYLSTLLNATNNPIATASYGDGSHAVEAKHLAKYDIWGKRILDNNPLACFFVFEENSTEPLGYVNLGLTGGTIKDTKTGKEVIEFGTFFADKAFQDGLTTIQEAAVLLEDYFKYQMQQGTMLNYGSIVGTFNKYHPWAKQILSDKLTHVTKDNYEDIFGKESFNAQRFQFNNQGNLEECNKWKEGSCIDWVEKDMYALSFFGEMQPIEGSV